VSYLAGELSPKIIFVSASGKGDYKSISEAVHYSSEGDQIIVEEGTYSLKTTEERYPIFVPPRCQLIGRGPDKCRIDGFIRQENHKKIYAKEIFDRPLDSDQSLVLLGDKTSISGFTICNSGANGVSNVQGARFLVTGNVIESNRQHGLLVFGANGALVYNNRFIDNGKEEKKESVPRFGRKPIGRQGHHVFIESRSGCNNDVAIIGNDMQNVWADAIANDTLDQPDGITMRIQVVRNNISGCRRNGLSISSSYSPSDTRIFVDIRENKISNTTENAIDVLASLSLVLREISDAKLFMNIIGNTIDGCDCGINAICAYDPEARGSEATCNIIQNKISNAKRYGIRAIGGLSLDGWAVENTRFNMTVSDNIISGSKKESIFIQAGNYKEKKAIVVKNNQVFVHISRNKAVVSGNLINSRSIVVNNGIPSNNVYVIQGSQRHTRKEGRIKYDKP
jgi:hypothetical protein